MSETSIKVIKTPSKILKKLTTPNSAQRRLHAIQSPIQPTSYTTPSRNNIHKMPSDIYVGQIFFCNSKSNSKGLCW